LIKDYSTGSHFGTAYLVRILSRRSASVSSMIGPSMSVTFSPSWRRSRAARSGSATLDDPRGIPIEGEGDSLIGFIRLISHRGLGCHVRQFVCVVEDLDGIYTVDTEHPGSSGEPARARQVPVAEVEEHAVTLDIAYRAVIGSDTDIADTRHTASSDGVP
jgi:hypothetical protein